MTCENVTIKGDNGTPITAYVAKPSGPGPFPGVVLVHHLPGWSEFHIETTRRFAHHGYLAICANLYERAGQGNPDDVAAKVPMHRSAPNQPTSSVAVCRFSLFAVALLQPEPTRTDWTSAVNGALVLIECLIDHLNKSYSSSPEFNLTHGAFTNSLFRPGSPSSRSSRGSRTSQTRGSDLLGSGCFNQNG
jgi:hypothetical protein